MGDGDMASGTPQAPPPLTAGDLNSNPGKERGPLRGLPGG